MTSPLKTPLTEVVIVDREEGANQRLVDQGASSGLEVTPEASC